MQSLHTQNIAGRLKLVLLAFTFRQQRLLTLLIFSSLIINLAVPSASQAASLAPAAGSLAAINANGTLSGTVTTGGSPVDNAILTAVLSTDPNAITYAVTNASGGYSMGLPPGSYNVSATKHGYITAAVNGVVITSGGATAQNFAINPAPAAVISGTIREGSGRSGALAAQIVVESPGFSTTLYSNPMDGSYSIGLYQQTQYTFSISALLPGYQVKTMSMLFTGAAVTRDFSVEVNQVACTAPGYLPAYSYYQDFESTNGDFVPGGSLSSWAWGKPTSGPNAAHSGANVWATNLAGSYNGLENSNITSPDIDLSGLAGKSIYVQWWQWVSVQSGFANVYADVSKDGGASWTQVYTTTGQDPNWRRRQAIVDPTYAVVNFRIRFRLVTPTQVIYPGYYIDDVGIGGATAMNEGFEGASFPPAGWVSANLDFDGAAWQPSTAQAHSGTHSAAHLSSAGSQNGWLVTQAVVIGSSSTNLTFWEKNTTPASYAGHFLWYCNEASAGGCGSPPLNYHLYAETGSPNGAWRQKTQPVAGLQGATLRFAFQYTGANADNWFIDDVAVGAADLSPLPCLPAVDPQLSYFPPSLSATVDLGGGPTTTSLTINNSGASAAAFNISERSLTFTPSVAVLSIPPFTGFVAHSPPAIGIAPQRLRAQNRSPQPDEAASLLAGIAAYAINPSVTPERLVSFNTAAPGTWTDLGEVGEYSFLAGDFVGGDASLLYTLDTNTNHLFSINTATLEAIDIGGTNPVSGQAWTGVSGGTNGILYAVSTNCSGVSELYTINLLTGAATPLASLANAACPVGIAVNAIGEVYGVDVQNDTLLKINLTSGFAAPIGFLGIDANYAEGLTFDQISGVLYWAAFNVAANQGELRIIDIHSGGSALVGAFPDGAQVTSLAFPSNGGKNVTWLGETPTTGTISGGASQQLTISFTPPTHISDLGSYTANLLVGNDTRFGSGVVPVTLTVQIPANWGYVAGLVTGSSACGSGFPLLGATVTIRTPGGVLWGMATTDAAGHYHYPALAGTYNITVSAATFTDKVVNGFAVQGGRVTNTLNVELVSNLGCSKFWLPAVAK